MIRRGAEWAGATTARGMVLMAGVVAVWWCAILATL